MKLYAIVTSERASKGQGGKYLHIEIFNEQEELIYSVIVDDGIALYSGAVSSQSLLYHQKTKGKKQKGERV